MRTLFYFSFALLFCLGAYEFISGWGLPEGEPLSPVRAFVLHFHGIAGLWFLFLLGVLFQAHVWPSFKRSLRHRRSGIFLWILIGLQALSVPFLYYLSNEKWHDKIASLHSYMGLFLIVPVFIHIAWKLRSARSPK